MEASYLKKAGLRITAPRKAVLEILEKSDAKHLSAKDVYRLASDLCNDISLGTVYRALTQFEAAGLVIKHSFKDGAALFELAVGGDHEHIVCTKCGHIFEFQDSLMENEMVRVAKKHKLKYSGHTLIMYADCRQQKCSHNRISKR